jgi:hypothetical protein
MRDDLSWFRLSGPNSPRWWHQWLHSGLANWFWCIWRLRAYVEAIDVSTGCCIHARYPN